jgi:Uma2 family endonuclease
MIATPPQLPLLGTIAGFRRFSVSEYHRLTEIGILTEDDNLELLEGYLVNKMSRNPPHDCAIHLMAGAMMAANVKEWCVRVKSAITLADSEPEPDVTLARGSARTFAAHHPSPSEIGVVVDVADSTLLGDRSDKGRIYSRAGIGSYWIVNLIDRQIEVYEQPSGPTAAPAYGKTTIYRPGDSVPLMLDAAIVSTFSVNDLLP